VSLNGQARLYRPDVCSFSQVNIAVYLEITMIKPSQNYANLLETLNNSRSYAKRRSFKHENLNADDSITMISSNQLHGLPDKNKILHKLFDFSVSIETLM
jgi:hypothetical protein